MSFVYIPKPYDCEASNFTSGGGCTKDSDGNLVLLKDQDADSSMVSNIINSKEANVPVGLIIGRLYSLDDVTRMATNPFRRSKHSSWEKTPTSLQCDGLLSGFRRLA